MSKRVVLLRVAVSLFTPLLLYGQQRSPVRNGTLEIFVAVVVEELEVKPVPLLALELLSLSDTSSKIQFRTGLDGRASHSVPAGVYRLHAGPTARVGGKTYTWSLDVRLEPGRTARLELSNANAVIDGSVTGLGASARQVAPEIALYERVKGAVLKIQAGVGHGSGFLLDTLGGIVVTNAHVVEGADDISVVLDSVTRVPAQLIVKNHDVDLAVLRTAPSTVVDRARLRLAQPDSSGAVVLPGERVVAIGFPLSQQSTITSGIVSSVRERAIISDVNINPGSSGGPLLNLAGDVVGINTFGEREQRIGPGISGAIEIGRLIPLLAQASHLLSRLPAPEAGRLPVLDGSPYPLARLRSVADTAEFANYGRYEELRFGDFTIWTTTTLSKFVFYQRDEESLARDRRKREERAGLTEEQRFSQVAEFHDWQEYVGDLLRPAVQIVVAPRAGETSGSAWGRAFAALGGYYSRQAKYEFKGDVQAVRWYRNGVPVVPVLGGRAPHIVFENSEWIVMRDVAYRGVYIFAPSVFEPDSNGVPPSIVVQIEDLKHYDRFLLHELPPDLVARVWNDFEPYYAGLRPGIRFVRSDPDLFDSEFAELCAESPLCSGYEQIIRPSPGDSLPPQSPPT